MKYKQLISNLDDLSKILSEKIEGVSFKEIFCPYKKPLIGNRTDKENMPTPVRGDNVGNKSGIYVFLEEDGTILYIGKATKNNIHERIWDHLQTPGKSEIEGWVNFPRNTFSKVDNPYSEMITDGRIKIGVVEVQPSELSSLAEVYLQTIHLPPLCKQIG